MTASNILPRRRTRTSTSPACTARPRSQPSCVQRFTSPAMRRASLTSALAGKAPSSGRRNGSTVTVSSPATTGQRSTAAGLATADADVIGRSAAVGGQPLEMLLEREHRIDGRKHVLRRAEGKVERDLSVELAGFLESERAVVLGEEIAHLAEDLRLGALEAVDRLLLVADREHRAQPARPGAVPAVNSEVRARRIAQYSKFVSCASSTRRCSIAASSL